MRMKPIYFSPQPTITYAPTGLQTVSIQGAESSSRCTAMFCASMSGKKIPPFLISRGRNDKAGRIEWDLLRKAGYPEEMVYGVQEPAWMDKELMMEWIQKIWHRLTQRSNKFTYLILNDCRLHLTAAVWKAFMDCNTKLDLIPAGYTSKIQTCYGEWCYWCCIW
jgi:DDE superfamily endonuclease